MIASILNKNMDVRLITHNVMAVYSTNKEYLESFIRKLKHSDYEVDDIVVHSKDIISYVVRDYNIHENIYLFVKQNKDIRENKFIEYLNFLGLSHLLWLHFFQLSKEYRTIVEIVAQLASNKPIVILDYIDDLSLKEKLYTLSFHVGLEDRLIMIPFKDTHEAVNNSTCQCYVKSPNQIKILPKFSSAFLNAEFNTSFVYYDSPLPSIYLKSNEMIIVPTNYKYSFIELLMIFIYSIRMMLINFYNWRMHIPCH